MAGPLVSIVIDNFNYARFLPRSIGSALAQTYGNVEVVVVDDASSDDSADVIRTYGGEVTPVLKAQNAGHAAAFNSGFEKSLGEIVIFLDSDDYLYPGAVERIVAAWTPGTAKAHFRLHLVDASGQVIGVFPDRELPLPEGDLVPALFANGRYVTPVTSGNAFGRAALDAIMPVPTDAFVQGADGYLVTVAPLFGTVVTIDEPLGAYVQHDMNHSAFEKRLAARLRWRIQHDQHRYAALLARAAELGLEIEPRVDLRDALHLESRIGSLALEPKLHPEAGDARLALGLRGAWACRTIGYPWPLRALLATWFVLVGLLPTTAARRVVELRLDTNSRNSIVVRFFRRVRGAFH